MFMHRQNAYNYYAWTSNKRICEEGMQACGYNREGDFLFQTWIVIQSFVKLEHVCIHQRNMTWALKYWTWHKRLQQTKRASPWRFNSHWQMPTLLLATQTWQFLYTRYICTFVKFKFIKRRKFVTILFWRDVMSWQHVTLWHHGVTSRDVMTPRCDIVTSRRDPT